MKDYLHNIKKRLSSPRAITLVFAYHVHLIKKFFKIGFTQQTNHPLEKIDIVIPTISKDYDILVALIESIKKNILHPINKFYIVSRDNEEIRIFCLKNDCVFIDELSLLGYGKDAINYKVGTQDRSGWIFQQLLKLSGEKFVEMENYLIIDSDTVFLNPHIFIDNGVFIFPQSSEWHEPYFKAFKNLFGYDSTTPLSYTSHMMIFNTEKLKLMKTELEKKHGISWDKAYLTTIDTNESSCVSDYDTYANWVQYNFPAKVATRPFYNKGLSRDKFDTLENMKTKYGKSLNTISFHSYLN